MQRIKKSNEEQIKTEQVIAYNRTHRRVHTHLTFEGIPPSPPTNN